MKSVDFKKRVSRSLKLYRILQMGLGPFLGSFRSAKFLATFWESFP